MVGVACYTVVYNKKQEEYPGLFKVISSCSCVSEGLCFTSRLFHISVKVGLGVGGGGVKYFMNESLEGCRPIPAE